MAITPEEGLLKILTQLLRVRLGHRAIFDVNIIDRDVLTKQAKLDDHLGRFLGYFT